jgi:hypothetical protein
MMDHLLRCTGFANHHPDIHAIGELTNAAALRRGVIFSATAFPLALPRGVMSPVNSRSATFLRDAFWALLLPAGVAPRIADVWRGFWTQRLMWEVGGRVAFTGVVAERNGSVGAGVMNKSAEDQGHFEEGAELVGFLNPWKLEGRSLPEAMIALASAMAKEKFWMQADVELMKAWVEVR